jgi:N-methylhydantoinase B
MPIVKIHRKGVPNEELIDLIKMNVRLPERAMGDFRAQLAAVKTGEKRFMDMIANTAATKSSRHRGDHGPERGGGARARARHARRRL